MIPGDAFHPAETILDEMLAQNVKQLDLVKESGFKKSFVSLLLRGERSINIQFAIALEKVLNIPAEFWIRLQKQYAIDKTLIELRKT